MSQELNHIPWPGWETVRKIGAGSFGTVYEIRHDLINGEERAALKVISIPRSESEIKSMRAEGQDAASITQTIKDQAGSIVGEYNSMRELEGTPNIVRCNGVHHEARSNGLGYDIYIMMELLTPLLDRVDALIKTETQIIRFGIDMCHALIACEQKGILHRDIKPENVFVSRDGVFKLGDFGVARPFNHTTYATKGVGTPPYMAPEIARGGKYNKQADIYSLGIMLYWLLNKRRTPFLPLPPERIQPSDRETAFVKRCSGKQIPEPVSGSAELKRIVLKACAFDPADRFVSAEEMLRALESIYVDNEEEKTIGTGFEQYGNMLPDEAELDSMLFSFDESDESDIRKVPVDPPDLTHESETAEVTTGRKKTWALVVCGCIALLAIVFAAIGWNRRNAKIPEDAVEYNGHYYYIYSEQIDDYEDVIRFCNEQGGYPATITSEAENAFLYDYLYDSGYDHVFIGATDAEQDGVWKWSNGEAFTFVKWNEGEPNNALGGEEQIAIYQSLSDGSWNDLTYVPPKGKYTTASIKDISSTSQRLDDEHHSSAYAVVDGNPTTAWYEGAEGLGTGEFLVIRFALKYRINGLTIHIGDQVTNESFERSSRPAILKLEFDGNVTEEIKLENINGPQTFKFNKCIVSETVTITIESVFAGSEAAHTAISEIAFEIEDKPTGFICEWGDRNQEDVQDQETMPAHTIGDPGSTTVPTDVPDQTTLPVQTVPVETVLLNTEPVQTTIPSEEPQHRWKISHTKQTLVEGESFKLKVTNENDKVADVTWRASKAGIVKISGNKITALKEGQTKISCSIDGQTFTCVVTIMAKPAETAPPATTVPADQTEPPATTLPPADPAVPTPTTPPTQPPKETEPPATTEPPAETEPPEDQGKAPTGYSIRLSPKEVYVFQPFYVTVTPDVSDYTKIVIHAVDPNGGKWDFTITSGNTYDLLVDRMDLVGTWTIYADVYNDYGVFYGASSGAKAYLTVNPLPL